MPSPPVTWSESDDARLRAEYPLTGPSTWIRGKTPGSVRHRAMLLGLRKDKVKRVDLGEKKGNRTVVEAGLSDAKGHACVMAECDCGDRSLVKESDWRAGRCLRCFRCQVVKAKKAGGGAVYRNLPRREARTG